MLALLSHSPAAVGVGAVAVAPATDQPLLDAYSETVARATERAAPAVIHLDVSGNDAPGGSGSGFLISPARLVRDSLTLDFCVFLIQEIRHGRIAR